MQARELLGLLTLVASVAACSELPTEPEPALADLMSAVADANPVIGSARGSGHAPCGPGPTPFVCGDGPLRTFSFGAVVQADGTVRGRAQTINRYNGNEIRAVIDCVNFFGANQNRAWMIATVTHSNTSSLPAGAEIEFAAADNGEGEGTIPDQIMGFGLSNPNITTAICSGGFDNFLDFLFDNFVGFDAMMGNIQVSAP